MKRTYSFSYNTIPETEQKKEIEEKKIEGNEIMVWGSNTYGQLGIGDKISDIEFPRVKI